MPTVQQIIKQAKQAHTPFAQTPLPPGANPSAFAYQQSWLNAGNRNGFPGMVATGNPADNAAARNFGTSFSSPANLPPASAPTQVPAPFVPTPQRTAGGASVIYQNLQGPTNVTPAPFPSDYIPPKNPLQIGSTIYGTQAGYDSALQNMANANAIYSLPEGPSNAPGGGGSLTYIDPKTGLVVPSGVYGDPSYPFGPTLPQMGMGGGGGGAASQSAPSVATSSTPAPYVNPPFAREGDPTGSLFDAFQRSLNQATTPAQFRSTWGG